MREAYQLASETAHKEQERAKKQYDKNTYGAVLQPESRVLVRNLRDRGRPGKLRSYWEEQVHIVTERKHQDNLVYTVIQRRVLAGQEFYTGTSYCPVIFLSVEEDEQKRKNTEKRQTKVDNDKRERVSKQDRDTDSSGDKGNWTFITARPAQPVDQVQSQLRVEANEFRPRVPDKQQERNTEEDVHQDVSESEQEVEERVTTEERPEVSSGRAKQSIEGQEPSSDEAEETNLEP